MPFSQVDKLHDNTLEIAEPILDGNAAVEVKAKALLQLGKSIGSLQHVALVGVNKVSLMGLLVSNLRRDLEGTGLDNDTIGKVTPGFEEYAKKSLGILPSWTRSVG